MAGPPIHDPQRDAWFTGVVRLHARLLYRIAFSVLRNPADAEDAVADALLKLLRTGAWQTAANERPFLARTVWRVALSRFEARRPTGELDLHLADHRPTPEEHALAAGRQALLNLLIDRLPGDLREPLLLSAVEGLNSREIGDLLGLPEGTVRTRLLRARTALRRQYQACEGGGAASLQAVGLSSS